MKTDLEIAYENVMEPISNIAKKLNINDDHLEAYGKYKAKINLDVFEEMKD